MVLTKNKLVLIEKLGEFNRVPLTDVSAWIKDGWTIIRESLTQVKTEIIGRGAPSLPPEDSFEIAEYFDEVAEENYFWIPQERAWSKQSLGSGTTPSEVEAIAGVTPAPGSTIFFSSLGDDANDGFNSGQPVETLTRVGEILRSYDWQNQQVIVASITGTSIDVADLTGDYIKNAQSILFSLGSRAELLTLRNFSMPIQLVSGTLNLGARFVLKDCPDVEILTFNFVGTNSTGNLVEITNAHKFSVVSLVYAVPVAIPANIIQAENVENSEETFLGFR